MACSGKKKPKRPKKIALLLVVGLLFLGCATTRFEGQFKMRDGSITKFDNAKVQIKGRIISVKTKMGETKINLSDVESMEMTKEK
jgi:hypothetical protein